MTYNRTVVLGAISLVLTWILCGCAGSGSPTIPYTADSQESTTPGTQSDALVAATDAHSLWGLWWIYIDPANASWEIAPAREAAIHANIRHFLEDGIPCSDCLKITGMTQNPDGTHNVDIRIIHPWPGADVFTGFDIRGITMWNGSQVWPASGLRTQDPNGTDGYVLNADGYTTIFNPTHFPPGSAASVFTYTKGSFASPTFANSTLNPYMDYWTNENRHLFRASESATRTWHMRFPTSGPFILGYAVDACWELPDPSPPTRIPDDFPIEANRPEPYLVEVSQEFPLSTVQGSSTNILVKAWDWQMNPEGAWAECPELWTGKRFDSVQVPDSDYVTFHIPIENETGATEGLYRALIAVEDPATGMPTAHDFTSYAFFNIQVLVDCCVQDPVAVIEDPPTDIITDQVITLTGASYDPDSPECGVTQTWDLDGDSVFDDWIGDEAQVSWDQPGLCQVSLKAIDECSLEDVETIEIMVHVGVTQPEDAAYRTIGRKYSYVSGDILASAAAFAVDLTDTDGPWDFTALALTDMGNYQAVLAPDHPEVAGFKDDFISAYEHFYKNKGIYDVGGGSLLQNEFYLALAYGTDPDRLLCVGLHETRQLGSINLDPPVTLPFPFWIFSDVDYYLGFPPLFEFSVTGVGWGEGIVTVPYDGGTTEPCLVLEYELILDGMLGEGSAMVYQWLLDDGTAVAAAAAANVLGQTNYDPVTKEITGVVSFNALSEIGPY